jgi:amino acid adenylation domain-containing protein
VAVLGVLRSGAAYVPLDPTFPPDRLQYMAGHAQLRHVLVTDVALLPVAVAEGRELLDVDALAAQPAGEGSLPSVHGDDTAYALYTSGSTGKPKGVAILHRNLVNFLLAMAREPGFTQDDTLCAATTLSFDIAGLELYLPLIVGGRMVITTDEEQHEPNQMWDLIGRSGCNVLQVTPSVLRLLQDTGQDRAVHQLRLFVGGEALPLVVARNMAGRCREFWNLYGPTETTIWSTVARIRPDLDTVPLGKPIANTRIYVLDARGRPLPPGVIGEIWIGGDGVAAGYLFQPELTAERFVDDPFVGGSARMYRTGDLGAWRLGVLHFHGRVDHQIKVRGFRIEPGDIESAADSHPAVRESVVVVRRFGDNDLRMVLYVVMDGDVEVGARDLREHLRQHLPAYMLPQHIETLAQLPKTPNGKIDRKQLPEPVAAAVVAQSRSSQLAEAVTVAETMSDPRELYLAGIWRELIGVEEIRRNDNFLDLGGHSMLAVEFASRVRKETGVSLRLLNVVTGTLASLAVELPETGADSPSPAEGSLWSRLRKRLGGG